jgi:hypothetical protein
MLTVGFPAGRGGIHNFFLNVTHSNNTLVKNWLIKTQS